MTSLKSCLLALLLLLMAIPAFGMAQGEGCGGECVSCHSLSLEEANGILKDIGTVREVKPAAVRGLYELTIEKEGKSAVAYLDYGKKHLLGGQIYDIAARKVVGATVVAKAAERLDPATLTTDHALVMGNPKGKKRLFVFTDPECPYCAKMHAELKKLAEMEPDLAIFIKLYPLRIHPKAYAKARVILAKKSLKLLEKSYGGETLPAPEGEQGRKAVDESMRYAESVGINATPTLVLPDGRIVPGYREAQAVQELLR